MKTKIIGTGLSGLVGSRIVELLSNEFAFEDISRKTGTDITDKEAVLKRLQNSDAEFVLHLAAYTNVDEAEVLHERDTKILGYKDIKQQEEAFVTEKSPWAINVLGTKNVVEAVEQTGKHLIHFSTDMVFSGDKPQGEKYTEEDIPNPVGWYATTKYEAEKVVESFPISWTILRIAYPYRAHFEKKEYVSLFKALLEEKKAIKAVEDHYFTPTFIDDIVGVIKAVIRQKLSGTYHVTGEEVVSPYEVAMKVAKIFGLDASLISKTTREEYFQGKAPRAFNLALNSDRIGKLGVTLHSFTEGLQIIKEQMSLNK